MNTWISILNGGMVSIFGSILSAYFCGIFSNKRKRCFFLSCIIVILVLQGLAYVILGSKLVRFLYPFIMHLPLIVLLYLLKTKLLWAFLSVMIAYLCCQIRRWFALLIVAAFSGNHDMQNLVEFILSIPLLLILIHFVVPTVQKLMRYSTKSLLLFGSIPTLYYVFDYCASVYTDLLVSGSLVIVEFMPFVCCAIYLFFLLYNSAEEQKHQQLKQVQKGLNIQLSQSVREINALRQSQMLTRQYRHDLRHHLQYVSSCIENGKEAQAQQYISDLCQEIETQKVQYYCENETANLILSAFCERAKKNDVSIKIHGFLPACTKIADNDLCVLFSNALENALHACQKTSAETQPVIHMQFYLRENQFFLQIINPCPHEVQFQNGVPVSDQPEHGIGVQSICAIVRRYGGVYSFLVQDGNFILRLSL